MSTISPATTAGPMRVVRRLVLPLLALETLGLIGLLTTWRIAAAAAIVLTMTVAVTRALRHASRQIDTILDEELVAPGTDRPPE
jgi:hypothetical protein